MNQQSNKRKSSINREEKKGTKLNRTFKVTHNVGQDRKGHTGSISITYI